MIHRIETTSINGLAARGRALFAFLGLAVGGAIILHAGAASAQTCNPFSATLKQQLFPHSSSPIPVYVQVSTPGCATGAAGFCTATATLPADGAGPLDPVMSLGRKCNLLVAAIQATCGPRFTLSNVDCDPNPGQTTQFTVTDSVCTGSTPPAGSGLGIAMSNELDGLSNFNSGDVLTDYEMDTIIPGCPNAAGNVLCLAGQGSGQSFVPGTPAQATAEIVIPNGPTIPPVVVPTQGRTAESLAAQVSQGLNSNLAAMGRPERCTPQGRTLSCAHPSGGNLPAPTLALNTTDPTLTKTSGGGARDQVEKLKSAINGTTGGCPNIVSNCGAMGQRLASGQAVPALGAWGFAAMAFVLSGMTFLLLRRRMPAQKIA